MKVTKKKIDDLQFQLSIAVAADDYAANEKKKLADEKTGEKTSIDAQADAARVARDKVTEEHTKAEEEYNTDNYIYE